MRPRGRGESLIMSTDEKNMNGEAPEGAAEETAEETVETPESGASLKSEPKPAG